MKNKEFQKLLRKNKFNSNSGFTLTELLVGLFMSIFVIGALGFGLITVLQATQRENSKTAARNENSRALDFISDELRRASEIKTTGSGFSAPSGVTATEVLALDLPDSALSGSTNDITYYLRSNAGTNWKGPLVLYRWGPNLDSNGDYTSTWRHQALIDGIDDTTVSSPCTTGTVSPPSPANPQGFYACITGTNTAQLFLTGQTKVASGTNDTQTNDSQVVARARTALAERTDENDAINWDVEGLGSILNCKPPSTSWNMRTDFTNDPGNSSKTTSWDQDAGVTRQAQPIEIDSSKPLTITSTAIGQNPDDCLNDPNVITHTINFEDPTTFNGDHETDATKNSATVGGGDVVQFFKKGFNLPSYGGYDVGAAGYDPSEGDQQSLGQFLYDKGLAIPVSASDDPDDIATTFRLPTSNELKTYLESSALETYLSNKYSNLSDPEKATFSNDEEAFKTAFKDKFKTLGDDQRIIGFEMGQTDTAHPGFDLQDNIFVVTSNVFKKEFPACAFAGNCSP